MRCIDVQKFRKEKEYMYVCLADTRTEEFPYGSVKKNIDSDLTQFLDKYREITGNDFEEPTLIEDALQRGLSVTDLLESAERYYVNHAKLHKFLQTKKESSDAL